jgi:hypothetical protein
MPYLKLSDQVGKLTNPQRSDTFVKAFRTAVREGQFEAIDIKSRFELPSNSPNAAVISRTPAPGAT